KSVPNDDGFYSAGNTPTAPAEDSAKARFRMQGDIGPWRKKARPGACDPVFFLDQPRASRRTMSCKTGRVPFDTRPAFHIRDVIDRVQRRRRRPATPARPRSAAAPGVGTTARYVPMMPFAGRSSAVSALAKMLPVRPPSAMSAAYSAAETVQVALPVKACWPAVKLIAEALRLQMFRPASLAPRKRPGVPSEAAPTEVRLPTPLL